jgi:23S rRNA (cytidine1920-2'-O)/16S rRNA (cytidine1409-2'-O)-methyltransferase
MSRNLQAAKAKEPKERLDKLLVERGYAQSRERAHAMILAGRVKVEGRPATKAGLCLPFNAEIELHGSPPRYASRGGLKLEHALAVFSIRPAGWVAMDAGASTGGFTDCLLQHGVEKVYAVDVGYGQLAWKLRQDPRVVVIERTNIRHMTEETVPEKVDLITADLSFISLRLVLPKLLEFLKLEISEGRIVALVKPQFEVGKGQVGRGGLVKDTAKHKKVLEMIGQAAVKIGLVVEGITASPLPGRKGNQEYFVCLKRGTPRERLDSSGKDMAPPGNKITPSGDLKVPA